MVENPSRPSFALLNAIDVSVFTFNTPIQTTKAIDSADFSVSSSNEPILSVEAIDFTVLDDSDLLEPTQDPTPEDESCPGLAEIQICAIDFFSVNSNILSVPTDIRIFDYTDQDESSEDDPDYNPLVDNPDSSFDCNNPPAIDSYTSIEFNHPQPASHSSLQPR